MKLIHYHIYKGVFTCVFYEDHKFYKSECSPTNEIVSSFFDELKVKESNIVYHARDCFEMKIDLKPISNEVSIEELLNDDDKIMVDVIEDKMLPFIRDKKINDIIYGN